MSTVFKKNAFSHLFLSVFLTAALVACGPQKKNPEAAAAPTKLSDLPEKASACEVKIRKQMEKKSIQLSQVAALDSQITEANKLIAKTTETTYSLVQKTQINSIKLEHFGKLNSAFRVKYDLSKNDAQAATDLNFTLEIESIQGQKAAGLIQRFSISEACALTLTSTEIEVLQKADATNYTYTKDSHYPNGETLKEADKFSLDKNTNIINFMPQIKGILDVTDGSISYVAKTGMLSFSVKKQDTRLQKEFGLDLILESQAVEVFQSGKLLFVVKTGMDKSKGISLHEVAKQKTWKVTKSIWQDAKLGTSRDINNLVTSEVTETYLKTHNTIRLFAEKAPTYPHIQAYWQITETALDEKTKIKTFNLVETEEPIYSDKATAIDLVSTDTIQTELPQIKKIAKEIAAQTTLREVQIELILEYLKKNYVYDHEMVKNNTIRPLTTAEALTRGKGVCQHYAIIFTAIARSLKIPTRIVAGFHLGDKTAAFHAWVETEIKTDVWRVIEPQSPKSLKQAFTRHYIPASRALFLEDKNKGELNTYVEVINNGFTVRPVQ